MRLTLCRNPAFNSEIPVCEETKSCQRNLKTSGICEFMTLGFSGAVSDTSESWGEISLAALLPSLVLALSLCWPKINHVIAFETQSVHGFLNIPS